jgi:hypothetical protein
LNSANGNTLQHPISKNPIRKKAGGTSQGVGPQKIKIKNRIKCEKRGKTVKRNMKPK